MKTCKLDRIYTWLSSALGYNQKAEKKYLYDRKEKLFFNLGFQEGEYFIGANQIPLSTSNRRIVEEKITSLTSGDAEIFDIIQTSTKFQDRYQKRPKSAEDLEVLAKKKKNYIKKFNHFFSETISMCMRQS